MFGEALWYGFTVCREMYGLDFPDLRQEIPRILYPKVEADNSSTWHLRVNGGKEWLRVLKAPLPFVIAYLRLPNSCPELVVRGIVMAKIHQYNCNGQ